MVGDCAIKQRTPVKQKVQYRTNQYLQSLLGWALNSFVMMQRKKPQPRNIDYAGLLYADRSPATIYIRLQ